MWNRRRLTVSALLEVLRRLHGEDDNLFVGLRQHVAELGVGVDLAIDGDLRQAVADGFHGPDDGFVVSGLDFDGLHLRISTSTYIDHGS